MLKIISSLSVVSGILHLVLFDLNLKISYVLHSFIRIIFIPLCHPPVLVVTALNGVHPTLRDYSLVIKNIWFFFFELKLVFYIKFGKVLNAVKHLLVIKNVFFSQLFQTLSLRNSPFFFLNA